MSPVDRKRVEHDALFVGALCAALDPRRRAPTCRACGGAELVHVYERAAYACRCGAYTTDGRRIRTGWCLRCRRSA